MRISTVTTVLLLGLLLISPGLPFVAENQVQAANSADLIIESITWSPEGPSIGDAVTFTVTIKNQGSTQAGYSRVTYYIDDAYLAADSVDLIDPGDTTTETFFWEAQAGTHTIKAVADSDERINESDETNNEKAVTLQTLLSDLVIEDITWTPENASQGDSIVFNVTVKNQGGGKASSSRVHFYIDGSAKGYQDVPWLGAGDTSTQTFAWITQASTNSLKAVTDEADWVIESNEGNNEKIVTFQPFLPDIIVEDITWTPESPVESDNVTFTVTIKNQGVGKADFSVVTYYMNETLLDSASIDQMDPGGTDNKTFDWIAELGPNILKIIVDSNERIAESDEANNVHIVAIPILPDLTIESITWPQDIPPVGETINFTVNVKNQGIAEAGSFSIHFYINEGHKGYRAVQGIAAEETVSLTFPWTAEAGSHTIRVVIDSGEDVTETDESNNEKTVEFSGSSPPDLIIQDLTWSPLDAAAGETVTFAFVIKNQGKGKADKSYFTCYVDDNYLYADFINAMNPGATDNRTFTWVVEGGPHIIRVVADSDEDVAESDEDNNEKTVSFPLIPDLIIEKITWIPEEPSESDKVNFTAVIKNQGGVKADSFTIHFYIDESYLGHYEVDGIEAEAEISKHLSWVAEAGSHTIKVIADSAGEIAESDENNNTKEETLSASPLPEITPAPTATTTPPQTPTIPLPLPAPKQETWPLFLVAFGVIALGITLVMFILRSR